MEGTAKYRFRKESIRCAVITIACYLLVLLVYEDISEGIRWRKVLKICLLTLVGIVLWSKVVFASQVYLKRDLQDAQAKSMLTRIVYEIEKTDGYEAGVTPVAFCGTFENTSYTQPVADPQCKHEPYEDR